MVQNVRILLLDLNHANTLSAAVEQILRSCSTYRVELRKASCYGTALVNIDAAAMTKSFSPDVFLFVLSPTHLADLDVLTGFIGDRLSGQRVLLLLEQGEPEKLAKLLRLGAVDFITAPLKAVDLLPRLGRLLETPVEQQSLTHRMKKELGMKRLVGTSPTFLAEIQKIPVVANGDATVLISGETGTGKELCARAIHYLSRRTSKPFIVVNCGAIPLELVENELFGHVQGAYTGATLPRHGLIHQADGGTLFLDEIDCLPLPSQVKLLRFLQEKEYKRLGSPRIERADVRIIAATNTDLAREVKDGRLRADLYYRLNVVPLVLPPLRERREDIVILARHFLRKYELEVEKKLIDFSPDALRMLVLHDWPGNVRELENVVERAVIFASQARIEPTDIWFSRSEEAEPPALSFKRAKALAIEQFEKKYIQQILLASHGNITRAAQGAQKDRRSFCKLIRRHKINVRTFRRSA